MSNETDLDWLARNVHNWPAGHQGWCYVISNRDGTKGVATSLIGQVDCPWVRIEKQEWLARRAELQNKPGWKDAPEWAEWLAQDEDGEWKWLAGLPGKYVDYWTAVKIKGCCKGLALGDWRDTLERRPADLSSAAVIKRLDEATQNVLAAVPALMDEKYSFEPEFMPVSVSNETVQLERPVAVAGTGNGSAAESAFLIGRVIDLLRTSVDHFSANELAELHQLCDAELTKRDAAVCGGQKYLDAQWFERGELPPVGSNVTIVEIDGLGISDLVREFIGNECKVMATFTRPQLPHSDAVDIVAVMEPEGGCCCFVLDMIRPIRTDRDVLIEIIKETDDTDDKIADAILAAGFSLGDK